MFNITLTHAEPKIDNVIICSAKILTLPADEHVVVDIPLYSGGNIKLNLFRNGTVPVQFGTQYDHDFDAHGNSDTSAVTYKPWPMLFVTVFEKVSDVVLALHPSPHSLSALLDDYTSENARAAEYIPFRRRAA